MLLAEVVTAELMASSMKTDLDLMLFIFKLNDGKALLVVLKFKNLQVRYRANAQTKAYLLQLSRLPS